MTPKIEELLLEWEERRDRGTPVTPADLCGDSPELLTELEHRVKLLTLCDQCLRDETTQEFSATRPEEVAAGWTIGQYEVRRRLGSGATGDVYEAWDPVLRRTVAVKVFRTRSTAVTASLERDGRALARLHHAHIVQVYEAKLGTGQPYLVMEFVAGGTLAEPRDKLRRAGPRAVRRLMARVAHAVHAAHEVGIIHRDLKPSNILLTPDGDPRVADFGLAKWVEAGILDSGDSAGQDSDATAGAQPAD